MATIAIDGIILEPQPAWDEWEEPFIQQKLNATDALGAFRIFRMRAPNLAGQTFNWQLFENQELIAFQTYAPGDVPTGANVIYASGVVSRQIKRYTSPLDRSVTGIELEILINTEEPSS